jgi:hypothetical protein
LGVVEFTDPDGGAGIRGFVNTSVVIIGSGGTGICKSFAG